MDLAHFYFQDVKQEISPYSGHRVTGIWNMGEKKAILLKHKKWKKLNFHKNGLSLFLNSCDDGF